VASAQPPVPLSSALAVRTMIFTSSHSDQCSMYQLSKYARSAIEVSPRSPSLVDSLEVFPDSVKSETCRPYGHVTSLTVNAPTDLPMGTGFHWQTTTSIR
jgi:hypothetical protein